MVVVDNSQGIHGFAQLLQAVGEEPPHPPLQRLRSCDLDDSLNISCHGKFSAADT